MSTATASAATTDSSVAGLMRAIADVGRDPARGGYSRPVLSDAELDLRAWFEAEAHARGLDVEHDRNGGMWAWWRPPGTEGRPAVVTGSHLDSVPGGGAFDGPLGVASALVAVDRLRASGVVPERPLAVAVFPEEEGSRFGVACLGSRLLTGAIHPERALALDDEHGDTFADVLRARGRDPERIGPEPERLAGIGAFVELHVEQGRGLVDLGRPVAVGSSILGHGRWRVSVSGRGDHAGTTLMADRADPLVAAARIVLGVQELARATPDARATVGRFVPVPGGTNVIASRVDFWLDARHPDDAVTADLVQRIADRARADAALEGCTVGISVESSSPTVDFDAPLSDRLADALDGPPRLATGAGHDAGVLAVHVPSAMLFVRNPTGVSHSPEEHVEDDDAERGAAALADALEPLLAAP